MKSVASERSPRDLGLHSSPFGKTTKYAKLAALGFVLTAANPPDYTQDKLVHAEQEAKREF